MPCVPRRTTQDPLPSGDLAEPIDILPGPKRDPDVMQCRTHPAQTPGLEWAPRLENLVVARQEHDPLVEHLAPILSIPVLRIAYEDLIADQAAPPEPSWSSWSSSPKTRA